MGPIVFRSLLEEIIHSMKINITVFEDPVFYQVEDSYYPYIVSSRMEGKELRWSCECGLQKKRGLPCSHLFKVLVARKINIVKYIEDFWILDYGIAMLDLNATDFETGG